ncbi:MULTISPECIES: GyrI-like domain-containing protein [unclassified Paenibacillus]|uniref:GyrI-like domain-containing protein n=1 Tax=unclassified Paenibacillus TaxID=185978 RepID=UPI001AE86409|nr:MULTISPECIES: GyrI-like domain-containing protein [unclassified Paenibacillus]MBP1155528.1 putative transcriptional regulator YdeE [Paenibacillus sp. PvP091]MBP1169086.1 putative transcriptional regulator YdeE [Paenibacillus sp. PvR098]MBP2440114.1 putative transcriptional regulator YdeE [Paenibacillus sp. PvP052]
MIHSPCKQRIGDWGPATLGVSLGGSSHEPFDYVTGALVRQQPERIPAGMESLRIEPHTYAVFTHKGPIYVLGVTYAAIHHWLDTNGSFSRATAPELESYDHRYSAENPESSEFDIYIPVLVRS